MLLLIFVIGWLFKLLCRFSWSRGAGSCYRDLAAGHFGGWLEAMLDLGVPGRLSLKPELVELFLWELPVGSIGSR